MSTTFTEVPEIRHASRLTVRELGLLQGKYRDTGCSHVHCHALLEIDQRGQSTVAELATVLQVDKSTASRTVGQLVRLGWVAVEKAPDDRRSKLLVLTPSGQRKAESINESANEQVQSALEQLSDDERGKVLQGMELYARALGRARRCGNFEIRPMERSDNAAVARLIRDVMAEFGAVGEGFSRSDPEVRAMYESYSGERAAYFVVVRKGTVVAWPQRGRRKPHRASETAAGRSHRRFRSGGLLVQARRCACSPPRGCVFAPCGGYEASSPRYAALQSGFQLIS